MHHDDDSPLSDPNDWPANCRLALLVSMVAALAAVVLAPVLGETSIIVSIIVGATCASWFHLEHGDSAGPPLRGD